jgi:signal transduction histidine kinase
MDLRELNSNLEEEIKEGVSRIREREKTILHQSKLIQMGEMISMIAHQWRQPLAAISATSNDLSMKIMFGNYSEKYFTDRLEKIADFSEHLSKTIDDFRGFYKEDKEKREIVFSTILKDVLNIVSISIEEKRIELTTDIQSKEKMNTYPNELRQVVLNLIKNAEDALLENDIKNPYIHIKSYDDDKYSYISVQDNGGGIKKEIENNIFEAYFSTKKEKDGSGLGLYMSKTIVEEHCEGKISILENENGKVTFSIKIPLSMK